MAPNNSYLTQADIEIIQSFGMIRQDSKHSGYWYYEHSSADVTVLIPYPDHFKIECLIYDIDGNEQLFPTLSKQGQTLKEFLSENI
ncbi:hypothetical protein MA9V1_161 [Chryseobacterium phage MA9V-1]|nr:hypothetical protein MA9V1_161 [Chryseobacterium phage MA9V-1]